MIHKNRLTEKMKEILELPSLERDYWQPLTKLYAREYQNKISMADYTKAIHYKYRLWFWRPK